MAGGTMFRSAARGFKDFIMRGNVIDLAVGIVIGAAFTAVVTAFTTSFVKPLINRAGGGDQFAGRIRIGHGQALDWSSFLNAVIAFVITAAVVYFIFVLPVNKLEERRHRGEEPPPRTPSEEVQLLREIRDALASPDTRDVPVYPSDAPDSIKRR
jgi:large conductance mechanosensitive channel